MLLLIPLLLVLPYAVALGPVRAWGEGRATEALGARCRVEAMSFSWLHGLTVTGLEVGNPPGFATDRPSLRVREVTVDVARSPALGVNVRVVDPEVFVEQRADGATNLQHLGKAVGAAPAPAPTDGGAPRQADKPLQLAIDVALENGRIEVRREGRLLATATNVAASVVHAQGASRTDVTVGADLQGGRTQLVIAHEQADGTLHGELGTPGLDLAPWLPLVETFAPESITTLAGTAVGSLQFDLRADGSLTTGGTMTVDAPQVGGPAVGGLQLGGAKWTVTPGLTITQKDGAANIDLRAAVVDLGWLQLRGMPAASAAQYALSYDLDVAALAAFDPSGELLPASLRGSAARLTGEVTIPAAELPSDVAGWTQAIAATAQLSLPRLEQAGFQFTDVNVHADLRDGGCHLTTADATRLDGGPLALDVRVDLTQASTLPLGATLRWQGGALHGGTAKALQYAGRRCAATAKAGSIGSTPGAATVRSACATRRSRRWGRCRACWRRWGR